MPNPDELIVEALDDRPVPRRRRRYCAVPGAKPDTLPEAWRALLVRWLARGGRSRWETLAKDAGTAGLQTAQALLDWLLRHGWAVVEEERRHGDWWPLRVELRGMPMLRAALGLPDTAVLVRNWEALRESLMRANDPVLDQALGSLGPLPAARALARGELLAALVRWREDQRSGTRRDFALFARKGTKAVSEAEWRWLEGNLDLADFSIERHTPLLLLSAPATLITPAGRLDLSASPDFSALTPATLAAAQGAEHAITRWRLVENRTSFERVARSREDDTGVIWLPGFPPAWWQEAVGRLLALVPAPAQIACDPDPAGIEITCQAGACWEARGISWMPWHMGIEDLENAPARTALSPRDLERLAILDTQALPEPLARLAEWMRTHGEKGEQEGFL